MSARAPGEIEDLLAIRYTPEGKSWKELAQLATEAERADWGAVVAWKQTHPEAKARRRAWFELHSLGYSYPEIAKGWGAGDHTTILSGVRRHEKEHGITSPRRPGIRPILGRPTIRQADPA